MTDAAAAKGAAFDVAAVAGPPLPDHLAVAAALTEAIGADAVLERAERGLAKARERAVTSVEQAEQALEQAQEGARAAGERLAELTGEDGGEAALAALKAAAAQAQDIYERAAGRLGGGE